MIDIGANLSNNRFKDKEINSLLENSFNNGIKKIILTSTDESSFLKNLDIINNNKTSVDLYTTLGLHPHYSSQINNFKNVFDKNIDSKHVKSIGEFGLDYYRMLSTKKNQIETMEFFLEKSVKFKKSLFLHERDAFNDFFHLIKNNNNLKVVHCFSGNLDNLRKYLDIGCYIGLTGWITDNRRNQDILNCLKYIPLDYLMIETDAPFLTPKNMITSSAINKPEFLIYVLKFLSDFLKINSKDLEFILDENSKKFFGI